MADYIDKIGQEEGIREREEEQKQWRAKRYEAEMTKIQRKRERQRHLNEQANECEAWHSLT